jgi:ADP-heptose:LPS heptosyltransferase
MSLADFAPLASVTGVEFFSLQRGRSTADWPRPLTNLADCWTDFADSAATMNQLDLIITVDTAIAPLAGAMGKPVWTLLPFAPHWRWGLTGETTPWYPTMRLFRQTKRGDWGDVVRRVAVALRSLSLPGRGLG